MLGVLCPPRVAYRRSSSPCTPPLLVYAHSPPARSRLTATHGAAGRYSDTTGVPYSPTIVRICVTHGPGNLCNDIPGTRTKPNNMECLHSGIWIRKEMTTSPTSAVQRPCTTAQRGCVLPDSAHGAAFTVRLWTRRRCAAERSHNSIQGSMRRGGGGGHAALRYRRAELAKSWGMRHGAARAPGGNPAS